MCEEITTFKNKPIKEIPESEIVMMITKDRMNLFVRETEKNGVSNVLLIEKNTALKMAEWITDNVERV